MKINYLRLRAAFDRIAAGILLISLAPVLGLIALVVRLQMGRPVFFKQDRVGKDGAIFKIIKFRTMVDNAEAIGGGYFPAELNLVPTLGRFLRRSSLDELPQLLNILRGDMSFVGPRPALPDQFERYTPEQRRRVLVAQGITGLAQIRYRNDAPWSLRIQSDLEYVERVGPQTDAKILVRTIGKVFASSGVVTGQRVEDVDDLEPRPKRLTEGQV